MTATFITPFYEPFAHAQKKLGIHLYPPPPLWNALPLLNQLAFQLFGKCSSWEGIQVMYLTVSNIQGVVDWRWIRKTSQEGMT